MSDASPGNGPQEFSDSDREWFAALSGAQPGDVMTQAQREGLALRIALAQRRHEIESDPKAASATSDEAMERTRQRLLQSASSQGLFEPRSPVAAAPAPSNVVEFPWWRRRRPLVALAASVLVGAVVIQQLLDRADYPEPPAMLGVGRVMSVQVAQPKVAAERLAAQLREAGLRSGLYQRRRVYAVDVQLTAAEVQTAQPPFAALGLVPSQGFNRIEFSAP